MVTITAPLTTNSGVNDVFITEDRYALMTTGSGIDVLDLFCGQVISSGTLPSETLCVTADSSVTFGEVYIGTTTSGIFSMAYKNIRRPGLDFSDLLVQRYNQDSGLGLTGNQVNDLDTLSDRLLVSTSGGVDFFTTVSAGFAHKEEFRAFRTLVSGSQDCIMTVAGEGYWSVNSSGIEVNYDLFSTSGTGIINIDFVYTSSSNPSLPSSGVNDFVVDENTRNLLGIATISGGFIVQEEQGAESTSIVKTLFPDTNVVSLDFSDPVSFFGGLAYVAFEESLSTVGLVDNAVSGTHFVDADILLGQINTGDQSLVTGTNTIIRTTSLA